MNYYYYYYNTNLKIQIVNFNLEDPGLRTAATGSASTQDPGVDRHQKEMWGKLGYWEHESTQVQTERRKKQGVPRQSKPIAAKLTCLRTCTPLG